MTTKGKDEGEALLDAKKMDGPTIPWTPNDIFLKQPKMFMTYHVMGSGYDFMTPLGVTIGGLVGLTPLRAKYFGRFSALQLSGNAGLLAGAFGATMGLGLMYRTSISPTAKIPWTEEGIQQRVDGLSHNYLVRVVELGVWGGVASAGGLMIALGGPTAVGLSPGVLGVLQGLSLGSAVGSFGGIGYCAVTKDK